MRHFAEPDFWFHYRHLPDHIRELADKNFSLMRVNPRHPSLRFKKAGAYWSVRVGIGYRALGKERTEGVIWFWIGTHAEYEKFFR